MMDSVCNQIIGPARGHKLLFPTIPVISSIITSCWDSGIICKHHRYPIWSLNLQYTDAILNKFITRHNICSGLYEFSGVLFDEFTTILYSKFTFSLMILECLAIWWYKTNNSNQYVYWTLELFLQIPSMALICLPRQ